MTQARFVGRPVGNFALLPRNVAAAILVQFEWHSKVSSRERVSFTADGGYDQDQVTQAVTERDPDAAVTVPPRAGAVSSTSAETAPTQRDRHLRMIADRGQMAWQKASGYNLRTRIEASIGRYKRMIGDAVRSRTDQSEATEFALAAAALNGMLTLGRPNYVHID